MSTELNYVHFIVFFIIGVVFLAGVYSSLKQKKSSMKYSMLFTVTLISVFLAVFSVFVVDKYTKKAQLLKINNKRILSVEKIVYSGVVKNTGNFTIGKVVLEIKLVNKGHVTGNVKGSNFYKPSGFFDFLKNGMGIDKDKPQTVVKRFVVARKLAPGKTKHFRIYFDYPPYFRSVADFVKLEAH